MPQARGTQTTVSYDDETTYGTDPGTPNMKKLYVVSSTLKQTQNLLDSNTLNAQRSRSRPTRGNVNVAGTIVTEISAENLASMFRHGLGGNITAGASPYNHTATIGSLPIGLTFEHDYGSNITGVGRYEKFNGCRVNAMTLDFPTEGFCMCSLDFVGQKATLGSAPLDASITDNGHTPFSSFNGSILEGGAAIATVTQAQIRLDNGLDSGVYAIGGAGNRRALPEGFASISGSVTTLFEDATLLNKAINDTSSSLAITLTRGTGLGTTGNERIIVTVQNLVYERTSPEISGPAGLVATFNFRGFLVGANAGLQIITYNALATI